MIEVLRSRYDPYWLDLLEQKRGLFLVGRCLLLMFCMRGKPLRTMLVVQIRAMTVGMDSRRPAFEPPRRMLLPYTNGKVRTQLLAQVTARTFLGMRQMGITPFVILQGMGRTECDAVATTLAPRWIDTYRWFACLRAV